MDLIPTTLGEASAEDKTIIRMEETGGKTWPEIRNIMEDITGTKLGGSTMADRYTRMKANSVAFEVFLCSCTWSSLLTIE